MSVATVAAPVPPAAAQPPPAYRWRWVVLAIVLVAEIMDLLDSTVITIAAPTVRSELGGSTASMQWWAAGYTLAFGVLMIVGARLGDIYGSAWSACSARCGSCRSRGRRAVCALDPLGVVLISTASLCIIYPLVQGRELGWPAWTFAVMAAGLALLGVFAVHERRAHGTPMIEPSLLRNRAYTSGLLVGLAFFAGFAGLVMVTSLFFQLGLRFSPEHAGLTLIPLSVGTGITAGASYALMPRFGRKVLQGGVLLTVAGLAALAWTVTHWGVSVTSLQMAPANLVVGLGLGFVFGPLFNVILAGVHDDEVGSASGTLNAIQQLGNSIGVALLATIFFSLLGHGHASPAAMARTVLLAAALLVVAFALSFLLPREARMDEV